MPLASMLFENFKDKGWLFAKTLGLAISGFLTWLLVCCGTVPFTATTCLVITLVCIALNFALLLYRIKKGKEPINFNKEFIVTVIIEELIFFAVFAVWTYIAGFRPAAYGTEKFMDFGFMAAMMRSETLPAEDLWYSGSVINYYYGGQYYAVFMSKLSQTSIAETYNVCRTMIAAYAFVLPMVIVRQLWLDVNEKRGKVVRGFSALLGIIAGAMVSLAGNMHYVIIGKIWPLLQKWGLMAESDNSYWFPNSTRFLGHYPAGEDQTIHEFPSYSFVLGDLHAHVVNIMYVLTVIGILYAWVQSTRKDVRKSKKTSIKQELLSPYIVILGFFIGIFQWTNYWDFLIYFVVTGAMIVYRMILLNGWGSLNVIWKTIVQAVTIYVIAFIVALPFTIQFKEMRTEGEGLVGLAFNHSILWQWLILWGLPLLITGGFIFAIYIKYLKKRDAKVVKYVKKQNAGETYETAKKKIKFNVFKYMNRQDAFVVILSLCAIGLIIIPELFYVNDIYTKTAARANTMFKLTYQAFIMFGICMVYILGRAIITGSMKFKIVGIIGAICLLSTGGYIGNAVDGWFGDISDINRFQGLDATNFLEKEDAFATDASAIRWLQGNIEGSPVVLEAHGESYSDYCRVSAMTGLPTIAGWYVHEWLWRSDTKILDERVADIERIYTTENWDILESLIKTYDVSYIFVGKMEREQYPDLNHEMIRALGEIVFEDGETYIVKPGVKEKTE